MPGFSLFSLEVSVSDVETIREGHQSEVLLSIADEFPAERCFTLVFRGRRNNLDLVAESAEEAQSWIRGMRKLIENLENMGERERLDQYPFTLYVSCNTSFKSGPTRQILVIPIISLRNFLNLTGLPKHFKDQLNSSL